MLRIQSRIPLLILVAALLLLFYPLLLGEAFFWGLPSLQFYPWREFAVDQLRAGHLALWNPYNGAGAPLFANYQSSLLYPFTLLGVVLPLALTMSVTAVAHLLIAGWGMWRFGARLDMSLLGRGASAIAFALSGYLVGRLGTYPVIQAAAWLPWIAWAALGVIQTGRPRSAGLLAIFTGLLLLAGHAQTAWYSLLLVGLMALWWTLTQRSAGWRSRGLRLLMVIGCFVLGAGIAALQLAATAELLAQSQRSAGVDFNFAMNFSYAPARILNLIAPNVFGTPANATYITGGAYFEDAVYIGLIPLAAAVAAVIGWVARLRSPQRAAVRKTVPLWLIVVVVGFVFALGVNTAIFPALYRGVPTFNLFQAPVRWHLWTIFGLSTLAGIGLSTWRRDLRVRRWIKRLTVGAAAAALVAGAALIVFAGGRALDLLISAVLAVGALGAVSGILLLILPEPEKPGFGFWSSVILVIVAADLVWSAWGLNPTIAPSFFDARPTAATSERRYWDQPVEKALKYDEFFRFDNYLLAKTRADAIRASELANLNLIDRVPLLNNYDPLLIGHYSDYLDLIAAHPESTALLRAAGVSAIYAPDLQPLEAPQPRAWLVTAVCWHTDEDSLKAALVDPAWQPEAQVQMLGDAGCPAPEPAPAGDVAITRVEANRLALSVDAPQDSWLVLADTDYPGWHATIDGEEAPIYRANLNFRAVQVSPGLHEVEFSYQPDWLLPGALVSIVSLLVAVLLYRLGA